MDINSKEIVTLIREIAEEHNVTYEVVRRVVISQFECVSNYISKADGGRGYFPSIRLPGFAQFFIPEKKKRKYLKNVYDKERKAGD